MHKIFGPIGLLLAFGLIYILAQPYVEAPLAEVRTEMSRTMNQLEMVIEEARVAQEEAQEPEPQPISSSTPPTHASSSTAFPEP